MDWIGKKVRSNWLEFAQQTETQATQPLTQVVATQVTADNSPTRRHEDVESSSDSDATVDRGEDEEEDLFGRQLTYDEPNDTVTSTAPADDVVTSDEDSSSNDESDDTASNTESNESDDDDDAGTYNSQYESEGSDVDDDADEEQEEDEEPEEDEIEDLTVRPNKTSYPRVSCFIARVKVLDAVAIKADVEEETKVKKSIELSLDLKIIQGSLACAGCDNMTCVRDWNLIALLKVSDDALKEFFARHRLTGHGCQHSHSVHGWVFVRTVSGKCPCANCRAAPSPMAPLLNMKYGSDNLGKKMLYMFLYANGIPATTMKKLGLKLGRNTYTAWRNSLEQMMAAAHYIFTLQAAGTVLFGQADEFVWGVRKYNRGFETNQNGQMWFQSMVSTDASGKVLAFFVRYVPNRTARTLQQWIIDLCAPNAQIATDSFSSYYGLEENARAQGKEITARMVNHQLTYKASDGTHTNSVEGMHLHARAFIRRLGQLGSVRIRRIWRVVGTAHIANPGAVPGSIPNAVSVCRFQRLLCGLKLVAGFGVPYKLVARMGATKKKLPHFAVASYDPLDKCFTLDGREGGNFTFDRPEESAAVAADALRVYEAEAAEERQTKKARTEGSLQESMKEKEAREKREARKAKELQRITERMEKAREKRVKSMAAAVKAQKDEIELGRKAARLARGAPADGDDDDEATPGRTRRARMPGDANSPTTRAPRTGGASSPTARAAATTTAPTAAAAPQ